MTYAEVDERRRNVGSAIEGLWREGKLGGHEFATVGIWSHNRPGECGVGCGGGEGENRN